MCEMNVIKCTNRIGVHIHIDAYIHRGERVQSRTSLRKKGVLEVARVWFAQMQAKHRQVRKGLRILGVLFAIIPHLCHNENSRSCGGVLAVWPSLLCRAYQGSTRRIS